MNNMKKYSSLFCALVIIGVVSMPAYSAISFGTAKKVQPKMIQTARYLDASNPALRKALNVHNLLNEMPGIWDVMTTSDDLQKQRDVFAQQMDAMSDCHSKKLGDVFKDPKQAWSSMVDSYEQKRLATPNDAQNKNQLLQTTQNRLDSDKRNILINREIMMDAYQNPSNYGQVNPGASFPLWQDQVVVFEKQWDEYYNKLNTAYGAPLDGRPQVDEKTRQDAKKYDSVLNAHKAYLASIQGQKKVDFKELPPKAPTALPQWHEIVMLDPETKELFPEMPEVWKDPKMRKELIKANPQGELAQVFPNGDINTPSPMATMPFESDMTQEYNMRLAMDSLEKGSLSFGNTTKEMQQDFMERLAKAGVNTQELDLSGRAGYMQIKKALVAEKNKAIEEAEVYIKLLEKQDAEHPELVQKRQKAQKLKQARLSEKAQAKLAQADGIVQISQMSPVMQQKLVVEALKKDEDALVHLTETNAMNVEQLMRERQSTNKIIAESQKQVKDSYAKQLEILPQIISTCPF